MEEEIMPPGFRFYPTEEELITFYLHNKLQFLQSTTKSSINRLIPLIDIYQLDPWHLPQHCGEFCRGDTEQWFYFMPKQERQARGGKPSRTTASGYWKATGSLSHVYSADGKIIGVKKTMVFYKGKAPTGTKTKWKMNEYKAIKQDPETSTPRLRDEVSLCRIYIVSGSLRAFDRRPVHVAATCARAPMDKSVTIKQEKHTDRIKKTAKAEFLPETERSCSSSGTTTTSISGGNCCIDAEMMGTEGWVGNLIESELLNS